MNFDSDITDSLRNILTLSEYTTLEWLFQCILNRYAFQTCFFLLSVLKHMHLLPFRIGITGSIATGKSTAVKELRALNCSIIDADEIARTLFHKFHISYYLLWFFFGKQVFDKNAVDRKKLSTIIFEHPSKRKLLNFITHPFVVLKMMWYYFLFCLKREKYVFFDIPLLYESSLDKYMNQVWVIYVDLESQKLRLISRMRGNEPIESIDLHTLNQEEQEMLKRINTQLSIEEKQARANIVVKNTGSVVELNERIRYLVSSLDSDDPNL